MVREEHRLGALQVRVTGQVGVAGVTRALQQYLLQTGERGDLRLALAAQPEPQRERDLVVAAAAGVQLGAGRAGDLGDAPFDRGVDVLVARDERERSRVELL